MSRGSRERGVGTRRSLACGTPDRTPPTALPRPHSPDRTKHTGAYAAYAQNGQNDPANWPKFSNGNAILDYWFALADPVYSAILRQQIPIY